MNQRTALHLFAVYLDDHSTPNTQPFPDKAIEVFDREYEAGRSPKYVSHPDLGMFVTTEVDTADLGPQRFVCWALYGPKDLNQKATAFAMMLQQVNRVGVIHLRVWDGQPPHVALYVEEAPAQFGDSKEAWTTIQDSLLDKAEAAGLKTQGHLILHPKLETYDPEEDDETYQGFLDGVVDFLKGCTVTDPDGTEVTLSVYVGGFST